MSHRSRRGEVPQVLQANGTTDFVYGYGRMSADTAYRSGVFPPGHVYFTDDGDRVPAAARAKADQNEDNGNNEAQEGPPCLWCDPIPGVPEVPEIPVA